MVAYAYFCCVRKLKKKHIFKKFFVLLLALLSLIFTSTSTLAATFTPNMAKRDAPGPFAAAPIVQGEQGTTRLDAVTYSRGTQVNSSNFYTTFDMSQGSILFWVTPEWDGNDNKEYTLFSQDSNGMPYIRKNTSNQIDVWFQNRVNTINIGSTSLWTAGSTHLIVVRWDIDNTLNGTNYVSGSIDDVHVFGQSSGWSSGPLTSDSFKIGLRASSLDNSSNALIEGLTIYRRPLFDGTYGIDVGNGDEINQIYNSGTGKDPTLVTGSWDVVFALPTNSSTGALTTGTGNAWIHPHLSNLLYTSTTNTGGFMMNGTYTSDGWADEGTPSTVAALATSEKLFAGGYKVTSDAADEGIYYDKTVTAGADWVVRALAHSDGVCQPKVILYDQNNTTEIGNLTGTTSSTRVAPDVSVFTGSTINTADDFGTHTGSANQSLLTDSTKSWTTDQWVGYKIFNVTDGSSGTITANSDTTITATLTGGTQHDWDTNEVYEIHQNSPTTLRIKLVNTATSGTCYWHQVEIYSNNIGNPSLEGDNGTDPYIPETWRSNGGQGVGALGVGDSVRETTVVHSGSSSVKFSSGASSSEGLLDQELLIGTNSFVMQGGWLYGTGSAGMTLKTHWFPRLVFQASSSTGLALTSSQNSWKHVFAVGRQFNNPNPGISILGAGVNGIYADDLYQIPLTSISLTATPATEANSTENTDEIRVDGRDTYIQTSAPSFSTTSGYASFNWRPRHSAADAVKFAETTSDDAYLVSFAGDGDDYINVYWDSANTLAMAYSMAGSTGSSTWNATGAISANTEYPAVLQYTGGSTMTLSVDGTTRITLSSIPAAFGTAPSTVYFGSDTSGGNQGDATFSNLSFDNVAPTISLTAYAPDPTTDTTPTLTGSATDAIGTVSSVQFQVDGTAGSWSSCTADDGSFDEASETFSCTTDSLADGAHTVYVRATDNVSNTTSSGSEASDSFTVDTTGPLSLTLDSPGSGAILTTRSPVFRFKGTTDGTTSITKYEVVVDFGTGSAVNLVGDIAPSGTDVDTSETYINYDLDYIEVQSKLASKELSEGDHTWRVIAYDTLGNQTFSERAFYVDFSPPALENLTLADSTGIDSAGYHILTATKPKITGVATDANYPESVVVTFYQQALAGNVLISESLYLTQTLSLANQTGTRVPFEFYTSKDLPLGKYKITVQAYDKAGNSTSRTFLANIVPTSYLVQLLYTPAFGLPTTPDTPEGYEQAQSTPDETSSEISELAQNAKVALNTASTGVGRFFASLLNKFQDTLYALGNNRLATFVRKVRFALVDSFATVFADTPTQISNVKVDEVGDDYVVISWKTNKLTINNKVNLGEDLTYGIEKYGRDYTKNHRVKLTGLKPGTNYYFEVMSQGKNYVYDAYYKFNTKSP